MLALLAGVPGLMANPTFSAYWVNASGTTISGGLGAFVVAYGGGNPYQNYGGSCSGSQSGPYTNGGTYYCGQITNLGITCPWNENLFAVFTLGGSVQSSVPYLSLPCGGGSVTFVYTGGCLTNIFWPVANNTSANQYFYIWDDAAGVYPTLQTAFPLVDWGTYSPSGAPWYAQVKPGERGYIACVNLPCSDAPYTHLYQALWTVQVSGPNGMSPPGSPQAAPGTSPGSFNNLGHGPPVQAGTPYDPSGQQGGQSPAPGSGTPEQPPMTYNPTNGYYTTNPPIVFTPSSATNVSIAVQQGSAGVVAALSQFAAQNHMDLQEVQNDIGQWAQWESTNSSGGGGLGGDGWTNGITSNQLWGLLMDLQGTNKFEADEWTNEIAGPEGTLADSVSNSWAAALGSPPSVPSVSAGGAFDVNVVTISAGGQSFPFEIKSANIPNFSVTTIGRDVAAWVLWLITYFACVKVAQDCAFRALNQRQAEGSNQEIAGFNAKLPIAFAYAATIAGLLGTLPYTLYALLSTAHGNAFSYTALDSLQATGGQVWNMVTTLVPVDIVVAAFFNYVTFRYFYAFPLTGGIAIAILFLLA